MATSGHELESINVSGLKATMKDAGNIGLFNEATCSTAAETAAKEVTKPTSFTLTTGATIIVKFTNAITVASATLNVGSTGAKAIYYRGAALAANRVAAGDRLILKYNGTQFDIIGHLDTDTNTQAVSSVVGHTGAVTATQIGTALTNAGYKLTDNNTWNAASTSQAGYVPAATKGKFLHSNASTGNLEWVNDNNTTYTPQKLGFGIGTCSTSSGTTLTVSLTDYELVQNGFVAVTFEHDVPANATLNINSKGAKLIYYKGSAIEADTIKADDTVMFAYDGTNYVVISLGGGGGSVVYPEFVTIQLTQTGGSDSDLIGATVVVTNDDTSATIFSTTWNGSDIAVQVDAGVDYTVTVGDVSTFAIRQKTQSYTAESGLSRIIEFSYLGNVADMGLPSGTLWARKNIDASQPNGFAASEYQYECSFFSYGNIAAHNPISDSAFSYNWGSSNSGPYASTPGSQLSGNVPVNSTYDIARAICGEPWRLPTGTEFQELIDNCDFVQADGETVVSGSNKLVTVNSIVGIYLKSKTNGNLLFFPCCGYGNNTTLTSRASYGSYRSGSWASAANNLVLCFTSSSVLPQRSDTKFDGMSGRAVM